MSDRMTGIRGPDGSGIDEWGRVSRADMIRRYRAFYDRQRAQAEAALAATDDELTVETFLGPYAQKNRKVVR